MKAIRIGICASLAFAVLLHGAVEVWSAAIFEISAAVLLAAWAWHSFRDAEFTIVWNPLVWPLVGLLLFGLMQIACGWSVYPYLSKQELLRWSASFIYFFLSAQVFRQKRDLKMLVWFVIVFGFLVALFGIVQQFTFNGKLYWVRKMTQGGIPFGPFVNRNHFAGFMELVVPLGLALLIFRGIRKEQFPLTALFSVVQVSALVLSASRGGIIGFAFSVGLLLVLSRIRSPGQVWRGAMVIVLLAVVAMMGWLGMGQVAERFSRGGSRDVSLTRRFAITRGTWHIFVDHPWTGTGTGTFAAVYPRYERFYDGNVIEHAHNDYAELLADMGLPGALLAGCFLLLFFRGALREFQAQQSPFSLAMHAGALAAVASLLLHSFVDFNLHILSNAAFFLIMAYLATVPALPREEVHHISRRARTQGTESTPILGGAS
jgi:O-antigen ligase